MKENEQSGFGATEALLIVVIIGILGFTDWYVWHAKSDANKDLTPTSSTTPRFSKAVSKTSTATKPASTYAGWLTYTSKLEKVTFKYPSGRTVTSNGALTTIQNGTVQEEYFTLESAAETLSSGKLVRANVSFDVATGALSTGECGGLVIHFLQPTTVSGRNMSIVTLDSATEPGSILGMYVTDEQGLKVGGSTTSCDPSFASLHGNSPVFFNATFSRPPVATDRSDGASI